MPGLLDGLIAKAIYDGFKNKLLKGTLKRISVDPSAGLNARGDPVATIEQTWACQGFVDTYSEFFRTTAGIPDTDSMVAIFAKSLPEGVRPIKDDLVQFATPIGSNPWYQLRSVGVDPATALWECRGSLRTQDTGVSS
jgi:hypothetical protein